MFFKNKCLVCILCVILFLSFGCAGKQRESLPEKEEAAEEPLFAYVGANLKNPVSDLVNMYKEKTGITVELNFNNSGALLNQLDTMKKGDIFMPGGMPFVKKSRRKRICRNDCRTNCLSYTDHYYTPR